MSPSWKPLSIRNALMSWRNELGSFLIRSRLAAEWRNTLPIQLCVLAAAMSMAMLLWLQGFGLVLCALSGGALGAALMLQMVAMHFGRPRRSFHNFAIVHPSSATLFRIVGWLAACTVAATLARNLTSVLASQWQDSTLATLAMPLGTLTTVALAAVLGCWMHTVPGRLQWLCLAGQVSAAAVEDILALGAVGLNLLGLWIGWFSGQVRMALAAQAHRLPLLDELVWFYGAFLGLLVFGLGRLLVRDRAWARSRIALVWRRGHPVLQLERWVPPARPLWIVLDRAAPATADISQLDSLVAALVRKSGDRLITLVIPANGQLLPLVRMAWRQGTLRALFPRLPVELEDWRRLMPPADRWSALTRRTVFPLRSFVPLAVAGLREAEDAVLLVVDAEADAERWRARLPRDFTRVLTDTAAAFGPAQQPSSWAGYGCLDRLELQAWLSGVATDAPTTTVAPRRPTVFISYVRSYRHYVGHLVRHLQDLDVKFHYDAQLQGGDRWSDVLRTMLENADAVVVLLGSETAHSSVQQMEIAWCLNAGKPFIPVFVDNVKEPAVAWQFQAANADARGIRFLARCTSDKQLDAVLLLSAHNILKALSPRSEMVSGAKSVLRLGQEDAVVPQVALALSTVLSMPAPQPMGTSVMTHNLRALAMLFRYKEERASGAAPQQSRVLSLAFRYPFTEEIEPSLLDAILIAERSGLRYPRESPPWMDWAIGELGQVERGAHTRTNSNPRICEYLDSAMPGFGDHGDDVAWAGAFVAWVLARWRAELATADSRYVLAAPVQGALDPASWLAWGQVQRESPAQAAFGDIACFRLDGIPHVAFFVAAQDKKVWALGGNHQSSEPVALTAFMGTDVVAIRAMSGPRTSTAASH